MDLYINKLLWTLPVLLSFLLTLNENISSVQAFHEIYEHLQSVSVLDEDIKTVHRTGYHFQPKKNWINDPNGAMYYKGVYHIFYQYNPKGAVWGNIVWAHSVSKDMISWQALEPAIYPSKPFDKYGCWSGSATFLPGNKPIILYTGILKPEPKPGYQVQNYAVPADYNDPYLIKWIKPDDNPIITPDHGENVSQFRDPTTAWFEDGEWSVLVGGKHKDKGIAHLYKSKDFKKWTKVKHPLHSKGKTGMWECVDFYPVTIHGTNGLDLSMIGGNNVKHVLKVSLDETRYEYYTLGSYDKKRDRYIPDDTFVDGWKGLRYDYGNLYASKSFFDPAKNRRVIWSWANESDTPKEDVAKGWSGIQLIPRKVWLDPSGKQLLQWPVEELDTLRGQKVELSKVKLESGQHEEVKGITAAQADVDVAFSFESLDKAEPYDKDWDDLDALDVCGLKGSTVKGGLGPFGLLTLASKNLEEYTPVFFRVFKAEKKYKVLMCSDAKRSSLNKGLYKPSFAGYVDVNIADKKISLRSLIDHSVVSSFGAGGKTCITSRVYPTLAVLEDAHLHVFNNGTETVTVEKLEAWSMNKPTKMN